MEYRQISRFEHGLQEVLVAKDRRDTCRHPEGLETYIRLCTCDNASATCEAQNLVLRHLVDRFLDNIDNLIRLF